MRIQNRLDKEFSKLEPSAEVPNLQKYIDIAKGYSEVENAMVVLSNLHEKCSYVFHGRFSDMVDIDQSRCSGLISTIWEKEIFNAIHPDDLEMKMLQELLFFHYIHQHPARRRFSQCLMQKIRMRSRKGEYIEVLHRLHYIPSSDGRSPWLALCIYGVMAPRCTLHQ